MVPFAIDASGDGLWEAERECISTPPTCFFGVFFGFFGFFFFFLVFGFCFFANEFFSIANLLGDPGEEAR